MNDPEAKQISKIRAWVLASRPKTLPAAAAPVLVGTAVAFWRGEYRWPAALAALLGALWLQIGSNIANDYYDYRRGADEGKRLGPIRVTQSGLLPPQEVFLGMWVAFGLAALSGVYLMVISSWVILIVGMLAVLAAVAYTGGPYPFGYHGWGDVFVFLFFGVVAVAGTYYVQALRIDWFALWSSIPMGLLIDNILVVNNRRDIETDARAGKMTLAVRLGEEGSLTHYRLNMAVSFCVPLVLWLGGGKPVWIMLTWFSVPLGVRLQRDLSRKSGKALNQTLAQTGLMALLFSGLYAAGLVADRLLTG